MIRIPDIKFDQDLLERLFGAFVLANKSHWHCPPLALIKKKFEEQGHFTYTAGQPENWSSKLIFIKQEKTIDIDITINNALPASLKKIAEQMKEEALDRMEIIASKA